MPRARAPFAAGRLWLDFVNTDEAPRHQQADALNSFDGYLAWLEQASLIDAARRTALQRRAVEQPASATATLHEARRIRSALRPLAERGTQASERVTQAAVLEINRVLGRSTGVRRIEHDARDGSFSRTFLPAGDAFAALVIPVVESAADALVTGELARVRRCGAEPPCPRVFLDTSRNGRRRWCDMRSCGNRAKAARHRATNKARRDQP
ncbi:MAG: CGNR zinc finger domain-containing protein [Gemmatimonadaceae bacterium]|nr:CGNR zinc finger domain-containing protein [Gemmatimonadaceae bacterium]